MDQPRVTVGLSVHNDPDGLRRTVPSVFGQTWRGPLGLLVVDDGSTDDTPKVLESLSEVYGPIDVVRLPINQGRSHARNTVLEHAGDDYLAWIDAGDLWHPRKLELQVATLLDTEKHDPETPLLCVGPMRWVMGATGETGVRAPSVDGDQLLNSLTGAIPPYLQGIVGRAAHFRSFGGFDEQLLRRHDYDFLVRFVATGGRVVTTADDPPLFTQLRAGARTLPQQVAAANATLREKHRPYYQRYGRRLTRQVRGDQDRLVARLHQHNGERARSLGYRTRAKLSNPHPLVASRDVIRRNARRRPSARGSVRVLVKGLRPVLPVLRRPGVIEFARRAGVLKVLDAVGVSRTVYGEVKAEADAASGLSKLTPTEERLGQIAGLEREIGSSDASPAAWLRLEEAYRRLGMLPSAESALERGLARHPGDKHLAVRMIELLPLRRKWAECVEAWGSRDDLDEQVRSLTYVRVARAFRECGLPAEAVAVAEQGLRRWPHELRLTDEVYINRAALVDWRHTMTYREAQGVPVEPAGAVTSLGFLAGGGGPVEGRLAAAIADTRQVALVVNGTPVATTGAASVSVDGPASFSLSCHEVLPYLGDGDVVTVESEGQCLAISGHGTACTIATGYESRVAELQARLRTGYIFTKFGTLRPGHTPKRKEQILALYDDVSAVLAASHDCVLYPFYGNLLGAVREHDFIVHDVGGFDAVYVSRYHTPDEVRAEFIDACRALIQHGYHVMLLPWSAYVRVRRTDRIFIDLNFAWFNPAGELNLSNGWHHSPVTDRGRFDHYRESLIGNRVVRIPGNAEQVLEQLYGRSWAIPDQAFDLDVGLKRDPDYLITADEMTLLLDEFGADFVELQPDTLSEPDGEGAYP